MSDEFFVDKVRRDTSLSGDNIGTYIILGIISDLIATFNV